MLLIQLSAGQGPDECCLAVAKALRELQYEAKRHACELQILDSEPASRVGTFKSVLLSVEAMNGDEQQLAWLKSWEGSLQWICESPYRHRYHRKNWFIGLSLFRFEESVDDDTIRFEACRASGPGGQHVNKTDSAVRATHLASGISVKVQSERSQFANRKLARLLIHQKLQVRDQEKLLKQKEQLRQQHVELERGRPALVFKGPDFRRV